MGKGLWFVSGAVVGVMGYHFVSKHLDEIKEQLGIESPTKIPEDIANEYFNTSIATDENIKKGYYAIAKTYVGGDSDRDGSETDSECVSVESEEAVIEGEASDSHEDSESPSEDEETEEPVYLVNDNEDSVPEDREILGFQTQSDGSMICTLDFNKKNREFYNSVTGDLVPKDLVIKYIGTYDLNSMVNDHYTDPQIRIVHSSVANVNFIIKY